MNTVYKTESLPSQSLQSGREDKKHYNVMGNNRGHEAETPCFQL